MTDITEKCKTLKGLPDKWGDDSPYAHVTEGPWIDEDGVRYEKVGEFLSDTDFYQGLNMVTVIRHPNGKTYGYFWWNDISCNSDFQADR